MHIPDGFLNVGTVAATGFVTAGGVAYAVRETGKQLKEKQVPMMGVLAAFIFAAQMLNFPIAVGTFRTLYGRGSSGNNSRSMGRGIDNVLCINSTMPYFSGWRFVGVGSKRLQHGYYRLFQQLFCLPVSCQNHTEEPE